MDAIQSVEVSTNENKARMMDHSDKSELALPGVYSSNSMNIYLCLASEVKLYVDLRM